jgi:hypothetical protein
MTTKSRQPSAPDSSLLQQMQRATQRACVKADAEQNRVEVMGLNEKLQQDAEVAARKVARGVA